MRDFDDYYSRPQVHPTNSPSTPYYGYYPPSGDASIDLFKSSPDMPTSPGDEISEASSGVFPSKWLVLYYVAVALISAFAAPYIFN